MSLQHQKTSELIRDTSKRPGGSRLDDRHVLLYRDSSTEFSRSAGGLALLLCDVAVSSILFSR